MVFVQKYFKTWLWLKAVLRYIIRARFILDSWGRQYSLFAVIPFFSLGKKNLAVLKRNPESWHGIISYNQIASRNHTFKATTEHITFLF